jgi:hypothetical protein
MSWKVAGILQRNSALAKRTGADGQRDQWSAVGATSPARYPDR